MGPQDEEEQAQRVLIHAAMIASDISTEDGWLQYFALGGMLDTFDIDAFLAGLISLPLVECNLFARAVNDLIEERPPRPRAPYRVHPRDSPPDSPPDSSLVSAETCGRDEVLDELLRQWLFGSTTDTAHPEPDT